MQLQCPHCSSTLHIAVGDDVETDGGTDEALPDGLRGSRKWCSECGDSFSVYVY